MYKCPKCGGELLPHSDGLWKCAECGNIFRMAQPQESKPAARTPDAAQSREE